MANKEIVDKKKLLLIMPKFFEYPIAICNELNDMGYEVDFYDDRPSTNQFVKAAIRVNRNILNGYIDRYYDKIMRQIIRKKYDIVFIISGQSLCFDEKMMAILKRTQKQARFILYQWDSLANFPHIKKMVKYFDKAYAFDRRDCEDETEFEFMPSFYCKNYEEIGRNPIKEYEYDLFFTGTAHPKKYKFIKQITNQLKEKYPKQYIFMYLPGWILFYYRKFTDKNFRNAKFNDFKYKPLKSSEIAEKLSKSQFVLDSAQSGQVGLTIRVIETLGAKRKLITANEDVINYDFYQPENIYVYKGEVDLNDVFFNSEYKEIDKKIYEKYSLHNWLIKVLS